jgi:hypothetical protein
LRKKFFIGSVNKIFILKMLRRIKYIIFSLILFIPLAVLILSSLNIGFNLYRINKGINHSKMYHDLGKYYETKITEVKLTKENSSLLLDYHYKNGFDLTFKRKVPLDIAAGDYLIYVYGSSPVVSKLSLHSEKVLFTNILENKLNAENKEKDYKVFNFGMTWMDSFAIEKMAQESLKFKKPDLMVCYYAGAVDYDLAYRAAGIRKKYYLFKAGFAEPVLNLSFLDIIPGFKKIRIDFIDWFINSYIEAPLINLAQRFGLVYIDPKLFKKYDELIVKNFALNFRKIKALAIKNDIPLIFVTSLVNLEAKPFGPYQLTQDYYSRASRENNYRKKIELLIKAKDSEIFSGDIRPKSAAYNLINSLGDRQNNIYVFDLRKQLIDQQFSFGYSHFYDYGHPRPKLNQLIADDLYQFIKEENLN